MTNLRIYTEYPEGVDDIKGLIEHILKVTIPSNSSSIDFRYGLVIYDKIADKVGFIDIQTLTNALPA